MGSEITLTKYCNNRWCGYDGFTDGLTELLPEDDAATANWGAPWHMPTKAQIDELLENCTREWTQLNGVNGSLVTGPNGNTIFLPAAGGRWADQIIQVRQYGNYWSSMKTSSEIYAYELQCKSDSWRWWNGTSRYAGLSVRPVCP